MGLDTHHPGPLRVLTEEFPQDLIRDSCDHQPGTDPPNPTGRLLPPLSGTIAMAL
jgi:hypothetical protein